MNEPLRLVKQLGIGLIEIAIAIFVLLIAVLGLGELLIEASASAAQAEARSEALALAQRKLESLRSFSTLADYEAIEDPNTPDLINGTNAIFTVEWSIATNLYPSPSYKTATVNVSWEDPDGIRDLSLTSHIAREIPMEAGKRLRVLADWEAAGVP